MNIFKHHNLSKLNTLGLSSSAKAMVLYNHRQELKDISALLGQFESHWVLGGGSNVVLAPDVNGLTIKVNSKGVALAFETADHWVVEAEAGECWHDLVRYTIEQGWFGLENLALIPGTVGAAPVQNIGAYGVELDQRLHSVLAWNLRESSLYELMPEDCGFAYRDSRFKRARAGTWLIVAVRFLLAKQWQPVLGYPELQSHPDLAQEPTPLDVFNAVVEIRQRKLPDPALIGNAGSFFKNPVVDASVLELIRQQHPEVTAYEQADGRYKLAAGWLIDKAGWKAKALGPVAMHRTQALVLTNLGGATADDVNALASLIKTDIQARFNVTLEQEPIAVS